MVSLFYGRGDKTWTCGLCVPNAALYQAELHLEILIWSTDMQQTRVYTKKRKKSREIQLLFNIQGKKQWKDYLGAHYIKNKETAKYCVKIIVQATSLHYNLCLVFHLFLLFLSAKQFKQTDFLIVQWAKLRKFKPHSSLCSAPLTLLFHYVLAPTLYKHSNMQHPTH